jgi:predicted AAA+ superfamily ATPase
MTNQIQIPRILDLKTALSKKSHFLLGPRQTGKSFAIRAQLSPAKIYDLLLHDTFRKLSYNPSLIREEWKKEDQLIVIDEIQKLPELLDEVHWMIENRGVRFLLTGSSARKLRKVGPNLLGGRARLLRFHPFVRAELNSSFDLQKTLQIGTLPGIYFSDDPERDLDAYLSLYIQQEIANEGLTRNLPAFSRTLEVAALCQAEQTDFTAISSDAQVPRTTVHEYFQILEDTLMIHKLEPWEGAKKRKAVATSKYYFFDWGVARKLQGIGEITPKTPLYGKAFESYLFHELRSFCDYRDVKSFHYWRTPTGEEVDFILNNEVAIEVKAKATLSRADFKGLLKLSEEKKLKKLLLVYLGPERNPEEFSKIKVLHYTKFLDQLWTGEILS